MLKIEFATDFSGIISGFHIKQSNFPNLRVILYNFLILFQPNFVWISFDMSVTLDIEIKIHLTESNQRNLIQRPTFKMSFQLQLTITGLTRVGLDFVTILNRM